MTLYKLELDLRIHRNINRNKYTEQEMNAINLLWVEDDRKDAASLLAAMEEMNHHSGEGYLLLDELVEFLKK